MGSRLANASGQLIVAAALLVTHSAHADDAAAKKAADQKANGTGDAELARMLFKKGVEEYKNKQYETAAATLAKSFELDPKNDALFALAQSERLANKCDLAIPHYKRLLETTTDLQTTKAIQANLEICTAAVEKAQADKDKADADKTVVAPVGPPPDPPKPTVIRSVVTRTDHKGNVPATICFVSGGFAIGTSLAFYLISNKTLTDSDNANTLDASNQLYDRSRTEKTLAFISGGVGVALVGLGVYRVIAAKTRVRSEVAVVPTHDGGSFWVSGRF